MKSCVFSLFVTAVISLVPPANLQADPLHENAAAPPASPIFGHLFEAVDSSQGQKDPQPEHSGWGALIGSTARDFASFPRRPSTWVILAIGGGAALLAHPADDYVHDHITGSGAADHVFTLGKWIGASYTQVGAGLGLYLVGRYIVPAAPDGSRTNKVSHLGFDLIRAQILAQTLVQAVKYSVRRDRPTGECCAFPSGHAATAFAAASVLERHLGYRAAWPTLAIASYVATSRLVDNRHFLSDVVFGSALGMTAGWTVVGRHGRSSYTFVPTPVHGGVMLALTRTSGHAPHDSASH